MTRYVSLRELPVRGKRALIRVDFNVPLCEDGTIRDDTRIRLTLPSIHHVLREGGIPILLSHLGRPQGKKENAYSLKPVRAHLARLLDTPVTMADDCVGSEVERKSRLLREKEILLLENTRFHEGEEHPEKDPSFAEKLACSGDLYVNEAFGTSHRYHASVTELPRYFKGKRGIGLLMEKELSSLRILRHPPKPFALLIGGAKVDTKIDTLLMLVKKTDLILIGGGMAFPFLKARGVEVGDSLCSDTCLRIAREFVRTCEKENVPLVLPVDFTVAAMPIETGFEEGEAYVVSAKEGIPPGYGGVDIGPATLEEWAALLKPCRTLFWNGPMGIFEIPRFASGTYALTKILAESAHMTGATTIAGGGDSNAAIRATGLEKGFTHICSGGGAALEYVRSGRLPGLEALRDGSGP
ncbi:MAG: phosphoglycerate kinase [Simkaniaceae bacterium]|nr:phosphoglycerate kinase [Simkaniaceae bacterium]